MTVGDIADISLIVVLIAINAFFAAAEIAIISVRKSRLRQLAEEGNQRARTALHLSEHPGRFLATIQLGVTLGGFFASAVGAVAIVGHVASALRALPVGLSSGQAEAVALLAVTTILAFATLVLGELTPKRLGIERAEPVSLLMAQPIDWLARAASPLVWLLTATTNLVLRVVGSRERASFPSVTPEEIALMVDTAQEEGTVNQEERRMVRGALSLGDKRVSELMVPRVDVRAVPREATVAEARDMVVLTGHSRLPVYVGDLDHIVGVVHSKDLLAAIPPTGGDVARTVAEVMRAPTFVPETQRADDLLDVLRHQRVHMAVVVDEFGGTAGIVTLDNLLEELVGAIRDEYDAAEEPEIRLVAADEVQASGNADLGHVAEALGVELESADVDTVGGLVSSALGRIPLGGDTVDFAEVALQVLEMQGNRVKRVRITRKPAPAEDQN